MYRLEPDGFVDEAGQRVGWIELAALEPGADWVRKQQGSMGEYLDHDHLTPESTSALYQLFDGYVAAALQGRRGLRVLDVGCGIGRQYPRYVGSLGATRELTGHLYAGLDPIRHNLDRNYPFICGRIEDLPAVFEGGFDVFVFATSLDHFESIDTVAATVRRIARPGAVCLFWVGLHDSLVVAEQLGVHTFAKLFASLNPARFALQFLFAAARIMAYYVRLLGRRAKLREGRPMDELHFYYFTERSVGGYFERFGILERTLRVPGTNSLFATVRVGPPRL